MTARTWFGAGIAGWAAATPGTAAIVTRETTIDRATMRARVDGKAAAFHARGIGPGSVTALAIRDRAEDVIALFALLRLGAPLLCLDPGEPQAVSRALIDRAGARFLVGAEADAAIGGATFVDVDAAVEGGGPGHLPPPPDPSAVCFLNRSSGTTSGVPKLAATTHGRQVERARAGSDHFPLIPADRYLAVISIAFSFGRNGVTYSLDEGGTVILPPPLKSAAGLAAIARDLGATWTSLTPAHLRTLVAGAPDDGPLLPWMRILCSTAALSIAERRAVLERVSRQLFVMYGSNESGALSIARPGDLVDRIDTVGRVLDGIVAEAVDGDSPLPPGRIGELRFASPVFPRSYVDAVPGSSGRFVDGWYYPGDTGLIDDDGFIFLKGRVDDVINAGGQKVYPADIEECLAAHPAVVEALAFGLPEKREGIAPFAAVVLRRPCPAAELEAHCIAALGRARAPRMIRVLTALPRTPLGKIDRAAMPAAWAAGGRSQEEQRR
ncbi:MAG: class I adenylate-forming enzyme family protein [Alphaproteobacteria bacterium]